MAAEPQQLEHCNPAPTGPSSDPPESSDSPPAPPAADSVPSLHGWATDSDTEEADPLTFPRLCALASAGSDQPQLPALPKPCLHMWAWLGPGFNKPHPGTAFQALVLVDNGSNFDFVQEDLIAHGGLQPHVFTSDHHCQVVVGNGETLSSNRYIVLTERKGKERKGLRPSRTGVY